MKTSPKARGTRFESAIVSELVEAGFTAERIAEGGANDLGDIRVELDWLDLVVEAKARERLTIHSEVAKAKRKAGGRLSVVAWKRLVKPKAGSRRVPVDGTPTVVAMDWDTFVAFLELVRGPHSMH